MEADVGVQDAAYSDFEQMLASCNDEIWPRSRQEVLCRSAAAGSGINPRVVAPMVNQLRRRGAELLRGIVIAEVSYTTRYRRRDDSFPRLARCTAAALLTRYPVLPILVEVVEDQWLAHVKLMLRRLAADLPHLRGRFIPDRDDLVCLTPLASDAHAGGQCVCMLTFASGAEVVYKPRPVDGEYLANRVFARLNTAGHAFRLLDVLRREHYGWTAFVHSVDVDTATLEDAHSLGALAAASYFLGLNDLHHDNVLLTRDGPVAVDCEVCIGAAELTSGFESPKRWRIKSLPIMATHLLPKPSLDEVGRRRLFPGILDRWWASPALPGAIRAYEDGYRRTWRSISAAKDDLIREVTETAIHSNVAVRFLVRGTPTYMHLLRRSVRAQAMYSAEARTAELRVLHGTHDEEPSTIVSWIRKREIAALTRLDVPAFYTRIDMPELFVLDGEKRDVIDLPAAGSLLELDGRARTMNAQGLTQSIELGRLLLRAKESETRWPLVQPGREAADFSELSEALAHRLIGVGTMASNGSKVSPKWVAYGRSGLPTPINHSLFDGSCGVLLFLSAATASGMLRDLTAVVAQLYTTELGFLERDATRRRRRRPTVLSGDGLLGRCVALAWSRRLLALSDHTPILATTARAELAAIIAAHHRTTQIELLNGLSGAIVCWLAFTEHDSAEGDPNAAQDVLRAGRMLARAARHRLSAPRWRAGRHIGMAHGMAGVCLALVRLGSRFGIEEYVTLSRQIAARVVTAAAWAGTRGGPAIPEEFRCSWCNGGVGVLAATVEHASEPDIADVWHRLLRRTMQPPGADTDTVCCGAFGGLSLVAELNGNTGALDAHTESIERLLRRLNQEGLRLGSGDWFVSPGLYQGIAGIGYTCLRLAGATNLPSMLRLEWPPHISP